MPRRRAPPAQPSRFFLDALDDQRRAHPPHPLAPPSLPSPSVLSEPPVLPRAPASSSSSVARRLLARTATGTLPHSTPGAALPHRLLADATVTTFSGRRPRVWAASAAAGAGPSLLLSPVDLEDRAEWKLEVHEGGGGGGRRPPLYIRQHAHALYVNPDAVIGATWVGGAHSWAAAVVAQDHVEGAFVTVHLLHPRHRYLVRTHYSPPIAMAGDDYRFGNTRLAVARFLGSAGSLLLAGEPTTGRSPLRAVSAKVLDVVAGKTVCSTGGAPVVAAGAAPDAAGRLGAAALLGFRNGTIDLWDARARSTTRVAALPLSPAALEPLSRGRWAVGDVAGDGFITDERAWGRRLAALGGYANSPARATFAAAPAGDAVALACRDNVVRVWGAEGGEPLAKRRVPAVTAVAWWRDERGRDELRLARPWIRSGPPPARELHPGPGGDDND